MVKAQNLLQYSKFFFGVAVLIVSSEFNYVSIINENKTLRTSIIHRSFTDMQRIDIFKAFLCRAHVKVSVCLRSKRQ